MTDLLGYRPLASTERVHGYRRIWPLARQEVTGLFRTRWGGIFYLFCLIPSVGKLVQLLIMFGVIEFGPRALRSRLTQDLPPSLDYMNPARATFYVHAALSAMPGMVFFLLLTSVVVARGIARDRATNALELYWTRGISPLGYLFAKWWGGFLLTATMTLAMPLLLWVTAGCLAEDWTLLAETAPQFALAMLGMLLATVAWTAIGTLLSAIAGSASLAMVLWSVILVGSFAVGVVVSNVLGERWLLASLSVWDAGRVIVHGIAGLDTQNEAPVAAAVTLGAAVTLLSIAAVRRMRVTEALQ